MRRKYATRLRLRWRCRRAERPLASPTGPSSSEHVSKASLPRLRRSLRLQYRGCLFCARTGGQRLGFCAVFNGKVNAVKQVHSVTDFLMSRMCFKIETKSYVFCCESTGEML
jgi:hypothetical protein